MKRNLACARARIATEWLAGYDPEDGYGAGIGWEAAQDETMTFTQAVVIDAFVAGGDQAEGEFAIERATGQAQLDNATSLMREAAELFRTYEAHHRTRAREGSDNVQGAALQKAERNALMAARLEAWLAGDDQFQVVVADDDPGDVDTRHHRDDCPAADGFGCRCAELDERDAQEDTAVTYTPESRHPLYDVACRYELVPIPAEISDDGDLIPIDLKDRDHFGNVVNFGPHAFPGITTQSEALRRVAKQSLDEAGSNIKPVAGPLADHGLLDGIMAAMKGDAGGLSMVSEAAFRLQTADPRFDPAKPVMVNGFLFQPATEA